MLECWKREGSKIGERRPDRGPDKRNSSYESRNTPWARLGCILIGVVVVVASGVIGYIIISALLAGGAQ